MRSPVFFLVLVALSFKAHAFTLNARDFGAKGNGVADDAPALNAALEAAIKQGPGTVLTLPAGVYCLGERTIEPSTKRGPHLIIAEADGLTVEGTAGTVLLCRDLTRTVFAIDHSRKVTLRNFTLDADPLPFTQGVITACDPVQRTVDLAVDKGYDDLDRSDLKAVSEFRICDSPDSDGWKEDHYFPKLENRVRLGAGQWRLTSPAPVTPLQYQGFGPELVGKKWLLWAKGYKSWGVHIGHSEDCVVERVRFHEVGSGAFEFDNDGDVTVRQIYLGPPPGSGRLLAGGGGAMSFFNRGTVTVEDSEFSHIDDDAFNLGTHFVRIVAKVDMQSCRTEAWPGDFRIGDTVSLWDWQNKTERGEAKLIAAEKEKDGHWILRFDRPLEIGTVGEGNPTAPYKDQEVDGIDRLTDLESAGSCILRRNTVSSLRARCFLVKTGHSLIEDNVFHDTHMPAILAGPEFFWGEAPQLRGLVIRRNIFRNIDAPNISVATFNSPTGMANRDVTIEDNTFENYGRYPVVYMLKDPQGVAIHVRNTDGVVIRGNKIGPGRPGVEAVLVEESQAIKVAP